MSRSPHVSTINNSFSVQSLEKDMAQRTVVEETRARNQADLYNQINRILNPVKHSTVESKVKELQDRTGLSAFLSKESSTQIKQANLEQLKQNKPDLWHIISEFIQNRVKAHRGLISIPVIQNELLNTFKNEGIEAEVIFDPEIAKLISDAILSEQRNSTMKDVNYLQFSRQVPVAEEDDGSNSDFFHGMDS